MEGRTLGVTARELYRHAAAVLDEVERSGRHIVISRYGRAVAFIGPIPADYVPTDFERLHVAPEFEGMAPLRAEEIPELGEAELLMLHKVVAASPNWWMPQTREEARMATPLFSLEGHGLIESEAGGGWKATPRGISAASRT